MTRSVLPTAPPIERSPMRARPWFGFWRGLLAALLPRLRFFWGLQDPPGWLYAAQRRRRALLLVTALFASLAVAFQWAAAPDEPDLIWWLHAALGTALLAWVGSGLATALMGLKVLLRGDRHALELREPRAPIDARARTAVVMPICNEDIATVFAGLRATCESLASTGALRLFDFYLLSDTSDGALRAAELRAFERLRTMLGDGAMPEGARIFYRWRRRRTKRKAGNVADFCRRWGANYRYMVVLDADSAMRGDTLVSLVRLMEEHPRAGIIQTLPQAYGHSTLHARVQQFASRVTGRLFALGMAYWQLGESHYWGHNAILRVEPFMRHCALAPIPGKGALAGEIMSHDFVEAALMRRAGYEVWLAPQLEGSWEQLPPNLLDELQRDRRWCRGNLQNARLIAEPGWRPVHRVMLAVGALSYGMAPLWLLFVALGALTGVGDAPVAALGLWGLTLTLLLLPRALGVFGVWLKREQADYGGGFKLAASALLELAVSAVQAPVRMLAHTAFVLAPLTGLKLEWKSPPREASTIAWRDAAQRIGMLALPLLAFAALVLFTGGSASPHLAALVLPLLAAVPLTVIGSHARVGAALQQRRLLRVPDEHRPPRALMRAIEQLGFRDLLPPVPAAPMTMAAPAYVRSRLRYRMATVLASFGLVTAVALAPRDAATPQVPGFGLPSASLYAMPRIELPPLEADDTPVKRTHVALRARPARKIDDAVRERARDAVRRSLAAELPEPSEPA